MPNQRTRQKKKEAAAAAAEAKKEAAKPKAAAKPAEAKSVVTALRFFAADVEAGSFGFHSCVIDKDPGSSPSDPASYRVTQASRVPPLPYPARGGGDEPPRAIRCALLRLQSLVLTYEMSLFWLSSAVAVVPARSVRRRSSKSMGGDMDRPIG